MSNWINMSRLYSCSGSLCGTVSRVYLFAEPSTGFSHPSAAENLLCRLVVEFIIVELAASSAITSDSTLAGRMGWDRGWNYKTPRGHCCGRKCLNLTPALDSSFGANCLPLARNLRRLTGPREAPFRLSPETARRRRALGEASDRTTITRQVVVVVACCGRPQRAFNECGRAGRPL